MISLSRVRDPQPASTSSFCLGNWLARSSRLQHSVSSSDPSRRQGGWVMTGLSPAFRI